MVKNLVEQWSSSFDGESQIIAQWPIFNRQDMKTLVSAKDNF